MSATDVLTGTVKGMFIGTAQAFVLRYGLERLTDALAVHVLSDTHKASVDMLETVLSFSVIGVAVASTASQFLGDQPAAIAYGNAMAWGLSTPLTIRMDNLYDFFVAEIERLVYPQVEQDKSV